MAGCTKTQKPIFTRRPKLFHTRLLCILMSQTIAPTLQFKLEEKLWKKLPGKLWDFSLVLLGTTAVAPGGGFNNRNK